MVNLTMPQLASTAVDLSTVTFTNLNGDLVVRMPFTANNSQHFVWTSVPRQPGQVRLKFEVIQNRDLYVRSQKTIYVEWVISGCNEDEFTFHIERALTPSTSELEQILAELEILIENGRKFGEP